MHLRLFNQGKPKWYTKTTAALFFRAILVLLSPLTNLSELFTLYYGQRNKLWIWKYLCSLVSGRETK